MIIFLGVVNNTAYYLYYEHESITTLDRKFLSSIKTKADGYVIYAHLCTISNQELQIHNILFKKIPRDIAML